MKKFILAIVRTIVRFVVRALMLVTPARTQIYVFSRLIDAILATEEFTKTLQLYNIEKLYYKLNLDDEKPEVPDFVKLYNGFVSVYDTLSDATPPRPNEARWNYKKVQTL